MKKIFKSLMFLAIGAITLASCEDVPAPYVIPGGGNTGSLPYNSTSLNTDWTTEALNGLNNPWVQGSSYTQATGYQKWDGAESKSNKECEGLLTSPALNTASNSADGVVVTFQYILAYETQDPEYANHIKLYVYKANEDGSTPEMTTWTQMPLQLIPRTGSSWTDFNTESIQLPEDYVNQENVHLAFWFYAPAAKSSTYELKNLSVQDGKAGGDVDPGEGGDTPAGDATGTGTKDDPWNVAAALQYIKALSSSDAPADLFYTSGKISEVVKMGSSGSIQFKMSDDGSANNELLVYYCDNLGKKPFTALTDLSVGDEVIVCGTVKNYRGDTPEYNSGSYLVYLNGQTAEEGDDSGDEGNDPGTSTTSEYLSIANLPSDLGTNSYGTQAVSDESTWISWTWNGVDFKGARICKGKDDNGGGIQVQGNATDAAKQGFIFNSSAWPTNIQKITIVLKVVTSSTYDPSYTLYAGNEAHPTTTAITPTNTTEEVDGFRVYTQVFDLSNANAKYFTIANNLAGVLYIDKIYVE